MNTNTPYIMILLLMYFSTAISQQKQESATPLLDKKVMVKTASIKPGQNFEISVTDANNLNNKAWLGIFKKDISDKQDYGYESYTYLNKQDRQQMKAPAQSGVYHLRLYSDDPGQLLGYIPLNIEDITPDEYSIKIMDNDIKPSHQFIVKIETEYLMDSQSWLGIFKASDKEKGPSNYQSYIYVSQNGEYKMTAPAEPGDYDLRFYSADPGALITTLSLRVGQLKLPGLAFSTNKQAYGPTEDIIVTYTGHEDLADSAWIGFFNKSEEGKSYHKYYTYRYLKPHLLNGQFSIKAPATKGDYEMRLYYAETGPELLTPYPFQVTSSLDDKAIKKALNEKGKMTLYGIYFDTNKSVVKSESYALIAEIAKVLNADQAMKIRIDGHTDSQGDAAYNQKLSEKRAKAVLTILTDDYGVSATQIESIGFGETQAVGDNSTVEGRAKNRRVELVKL